MRLKATLLVLAVLFTGCSSSDSEGGAASTTAAPVETTRKDAEQPVTTGTNTTEPPLESAGPEDLRSAVFAYTAAFLGGEADAAYALLSERCHGERASAEFKSIVDQAHDLYGDATITSYSDAVDGSVATATYELSDPTLNQTAERWLLESGAWVNDDC